MAHWNDWDFGSEENREQIVKRHLARLPSAAPEDPAIVERKRRETAKRLAEHDRLFGVGGFGSVLIADGKIPKPAKVSAGTPEDRDD